MSEQKPKLRLGELIVQHGLVTQDQLRIALAEQKKSNIPLGRQLVLLGFVTEADFDADGYEALQRHQEYSG